VLKGVHDIVAGITGFTEARGDQIAIETLPFETTLEAEPPPGPAAPVKPAPGRLEFKGPYTIGGAAFLALLVASLVFLLSRKRAARTAEDMAAEALAAGSASRALEGATTPDEAMENQISENQNEQARLEAQALRGIKLPANTKKTDVLVKHIRDSVQKDSTNATNVLRTWLSDAETKRAL